MAFTQQSYSQRLSVRTAAGNQMTAWNGDPIAVPGSPGISAGFIYFTRAYVDAYVASNYAYMGILTAGSNCANSYVGVYQASNGSLLGETADVSSQMETVAILRAAFVSGISALPINTELWLAVLIGSQTSTPTVVGRSAYGHNIGMSSDYRFMLSSSGGYTSLPGTAPAMSPASNGSQSMPFIGIGPN
jgi:hypothetical protein